MSRTPASIPWLAVYAAAMGWLEAVVVVYIRAVLGLARGARMPPATEVMRRFQQHPWLLPTEQGREVATMLMIAAVAWMSADRMRQRFGAFLVIFGIWDITYYVALNILVRWPTSVMSMDLLFLIPPHRWWYQPVWVPVVLSCVMIGVGVRLLSPSRTGGLRRPLS